MILITGATGFVGRRLLLRLAQIPHMRTRVLLRPGAQLDKLPRGVDVHAMMGAPGDHDALVRAMDGVHTVFHLIGTDNRGRYARLQDVDIPWAKAVVNAALDARVGRIITLSRVGADRGSALPILRAKGEIEDTIRRSGLAYTIFRCGFLFGEGDSFSEPIAMLIRAFPLFFVPNDGEQVLQPLWVEDLVTCLAMSLRDLNLIDQVVPLGGPELLTFRRVAMRVMYAMGTRRPIVELPLLVHRAVSWYFDGLFARWPVSENWIEMLSTTQTAEIGNIERMFGFRPAAFDIGLIDRYLKGRRFMAEFLDYILSTQW
jgi:NADH dehydrogenase